MKNQVLCPKCRLPDKSPITLCEVGDYSATVWRYHAGLTEILATNFAVACGTCKSMTFIKSCQVSDLPEFIVAVINRYLNQTPEAKNFEKLKKAYSEIEALGRIGREALTTLAKEVTNENTA